MMTSEASRERTRKQASKENDHSGYFLASSSYGKYGKPKKSLEDVKKKKTR